MPPRTLEEILAGVELPQPETSYKPVSAGSRIFGGLMKAGDVGEKFGQSVVGVIAGPIATTIAALRGMGALTAAGISKATGVGDTMRILEKEGRAQQIEMQRAEFARPAATMAGALGQGLKLGSAMAAPLLGPMAAATSAPGYVTGATVAGIPALPASIGIGLEHVQPDEPLAKSIGDVAMTGVAGTTAAMAIGGAIGGLDDYRKFRIEKMAKKLDKAVGQAAQSMPDDFPRNKRAFALIGKDELKKIKTYEDLRDAADDAVTAIRGRQDQYLDDVGATGPTKLKFFARVAGEGKNAVRSNPVMDALDDLAELYEKTNDPESLSAIRSLTDKAKRIGLTPAETNQLARDYGTEFGKKAFSARTGDPLTSVNAQAYENTRKAVKDAARSILPDDYSKELDRAMSDALDLRHQAETVTEKVQALRNKVQERGLGEKLGRAVGWVIDRLTFGFGKGAVSKAFFPSNIGEKQMNWLDVERALPKNLKIIDQLLEASDDEMVRQLNSLMRGSGMTPLVLPKSPTPPVSVVPEEIIPDDITDAGARADALKNDGLR